MFDIPISLLGVNRIPAAARQSQAPAKKAAAPKTDVIDLSKPPTPEQAERMRGAGFLGCGSWSAEKTVTTERMGSGGAAARTTMEYQHEYFDMTVGIAYHSVYSSVSADAYTSAGYAFVEATTQMGCTWEDGSYWEATLHECAYSLKLSGHSSWYIPPHLNEDGSWSLAEYGPSPQFTVSGYHSTFSFTYSDGEQTQYFWSETVFEQVKGMIPGGPLPDGAQKLPPSWDYQDMLDRLDQLADRLGDRGGFDAQA